MGINFAFFLTVGNPENILTQTRINHVAENKGKTAGTK